MRRILRDEGGQSVVLIAVSLPVVLSLLLLVIDGGRLYVERERIRNAAQLAAEAAVSLAADAPGSSGPSDAQVRQIVKEALDRNLPGEAFTYTVTNPFRRDLTTFNVKVAVAKPFRASVRAVSFNIAADAAARLSDAGRGASIFGQGVLSASASAAATFARVSTRGTIKSIALDPERERLYATHYTTPGYVSVMDTRANRMIAEIPVGPLPDGVAVDVARGRVYVAHVLPGRLTVIDGRTLRVTSDVPLVDWRANDVAVDRDGRAFIGAFSEIGGPGRPNAILLFDGPTKVATILLPLGSRTSDLETDPAGRTLGFTQFAPQIGLLSTARVDPPRDVATGQGSQALVIGADGTAIAVGAGGQGPEIVMVDTASATVVRRVPVQPPTGGGTGQLVPIGVAASERAGRVYVSGIERQWGGPTPTDRGVVYAVERGTGRTTGVVDVGGRTAGRIALDAGRSRLYVVSGREIVVFPE